MKLGLLCLGLLTFVELGSCHFASESNALHDVIHHLYGQFSDSTHLMQSALKPLYEEVFEKAECSEKSSSNCSQCLDDLITAFVPDEIETLEEWNNASEAMLYAILDIPTFCNMSQGEMASLDTTEALLSVLGVEPTGTVGEEEIEELLELLHEGFSEEEHHDEEHHDEDDHDEDHHDEETTSASLPTAASNHEDDHDHDEDHEDDHDEHDHETTRCFGEGTLLYYLGLDHDETLESGRVPEMAGILISYLARDWIVKDSCEVVPRQLDVLKALFESLGISTDTLTEEGFEMLLEELNIGSVSGAPTVPTDTGHDHDHKRSISSSTRFRRSGEAEALTSQCMGEATLAAIYNLDVHNGISQDEFVSLCPALIQQQISGSCVSPEITTLPPVESVGPTTAEIYGYGTLAAIIVSVVAALGAVLIPILHTKVVQYVLSFFVAMGISTLIGDALLHLIPQALGLHSHGTGEGDSHDDHEGHAPGISEASSLQLISCVAIYFFWLFEALMQRFKPASGKVRDGSNQVKAIGASGDTSSEDSESSPASEKADDSKGGKVKGIPPLAMMIIVGDGVHNFIDGIAIGAAFATSLQDGLGTSIAIFCHELPHELGDFSILIKVGMSKIRAVLFNLLSASFCVIGLFVGAAVSEANEGARKWLLSITAGMFMYLALVDMVPELMKPPKEGKWWIHFLLQNIGLIVGFSLMLIIVVFEDSLIHM